MLEGKDPYLKEVFPSPPMVAFRRAQNLKDKLVKAKVPPPPSKREKRNLPGIKSCNKGLFETCPFVKQCKEFKSHFNKKSVKLNTALDCTSSNIVYCLLCNKSKCNQFYIGQTSQQLRERFSDHKSSVKHRRSNAIGEHFNGPGHTMANMNILALEKVFTKGKPIIEKRESHYINILEAEHKGLNRRK